MQSTLIVTHNYVLVIKFILVNMLRRFLELTNPDISLAFAVASPSLPSVGAP